MFRLSDDSILVTMVRLSLRKTQPIMISPSNISSDYHTKATSTLPNIRTTNERTYSESDSEFVVVLDSVLHSPPRR